MTIYEKGFLFKGFVITEDKKCIEKFKGRTDFKSYKQVKSLPEFAGIIDDYVVLVDVDDQEEADKLYNIIKEEGVQCVVIQTTRGKHFYFKNDETIYTNNKTSASLAIGIAADIKLGKRNSYSVLKYGNQEREVVRQSETLDFIPSWLRVIKYKPDFTNMKDGDGRNQALFNYILTLQKEGMSIKEVKKTIRLINQYILDEPLSDDELEKTVLRNESFKKQLFFNKSKFLHHVFGDYLKREEHIVAINDNLHIYNDGIYVDRLKNLHSVMVKHIPSITKNQRNETLSYLEAVAEDTELSNVNKIPFQNGLFNLLTGELEGFTPNYVSKNKIPTEYNPSAKSGVIDNFLDDLSCNDKSIRAVIEEMVGTVLYRSSDFDAFFILIGDGSNGKSTLLEMIIKMIGEENTSSLELKDLDKTFKTAELFGKLANIGDDISSKDIKNSSFIKKLASGNKVNVEKKGMNPFEMKPYAKMIFSSNSTPVIHDTSHGINRRLMLIPLNNKFEKNVRFKEEIMRSENLEYLLLLGIRGLKRVLKNDGNFTSSTVINKANDDYKKLNNPVLAYLDEVDHEDLLNESTEDVFLQFTTWCAKNNYRYEFQQQKFTSELKNVTGFSTKKKRIPKSDFRYGKKQAYHIYVPSHEE